jgi:thiamine-monophosphate kinase
MIVSEFTLIHRYFATQSQHRSDVILGIGDDCALLQVPSGESLAATVDMLVAGTHFLPDADPEGVGHKALAVNLSDLAAMGALPAWATLALSLPAADEDWLAGFCRGLFQLARRFQVQLVGGDMTRGPLTISIQAHGFVPTDKALRRDRACPGDILCVTGTLGDAGLALAAATGKITVSARYQRYLQTRLERPLPRIAQGLALRGLASAAIDISDGLAQDVGHILERSQVGACLNVDRLPRSAALADCLDTDEAIQLSLSSGDDYELCFTVPLQHLTQVRKLAADWDCRYTEIGIIESELGLRCQRENNTPFPMQKLGHDHFS